MQSRFVLVWASKPQQTGLAFTLSDEWFPYQESLRQIETARLAPNKSEQCIWDLLVAKQINVYRITRKAKCDEKRIVLFGNEPLNILRKFKSTIQKWMLMGEHNQNVKRSEIKGS